MTDKKIVENNNNLLEAQVQKEQENLKLQLRSLYEDEFNMRLRRIKRETKNLIRFTPPRNERIPLSNLSVMQIQHLKESHRQNLVAFCGSNSEKPIRRGTTKENQRSFSREKIFECPLKDLQQRNFHPMPKRIDDILLYILVHTPNTEGLFRKAGSKLRVQELKSQLDSESLKDAMEWSTISAHDLVDIIKTFIRDIPGSIMTRQLSKCLYKILTVLNLSEDKAWQLIRAITILLPDENRIVLQSLLTFLQRLSQHKEKNQMNTSNLALCLSPIFFHAIFDNVPNSSIEEKKKIHDSCKIMLELMIDRLDDLFEVEEEKICINYAGYRNNSRPDLNFFTKHFKLSKEKCPWTWVLQKDDKHLLLQLFKTLDCQESHNAEEIAGISDRLDFFKSSCIVHNADTGFILEKIYLERTSWDKDILRYSLEKELTIPVNSRVRLLYTTGNFHPPREVIGSLKVVQISQESFFLFISSEYPKYEWVDLYDPIKPLAHIFFEFFHIERIGDGQTKITYSSMIDLKGFSIEWYNSYWGLHSLRKISNLSNSL